MLDEHGWFEPWVETWTSEGFPWASTSARHRFETQPAFEEYERLIEEYRAHGLRP